MSNILAKLDQNESPIPPPPDLLDEACRLTSKEINRYQKRELYEQVRELYADYIGLDKEYIWIQPGVDLFLEDIFIIFEKRNIIVPHPSYFLFIEQAKHYGFNVTKIPLDDTFPKNLAVLIQHGRNIIYIDNPNNPTGRIVIRRNDLISLVKRTENLFLIDEAYYEFSNYTLKDLVEKYYNVIVFRTMSKAFGFAGGRVAFCIINPLLAERIFYYNIIRFRLSTMSLAMAKILLENKYYIRKIISLIERERSRIIRRVREMGLSVYDSYTNFVMIKTSIPEISKLLYREGVLVKDLGMILGKEFAGYIRVTIGLPRENNIFLNALEKIVSKNTVI